MALSHNENRNCLSLGPLPIGLKTKTLTGKVMDNEATSILGKCPEAQFMLKEIEKNLFERYPSVFDGTLNEVKRFPELFNYGVETKKGLKAFAMQYANEYEIMDRIKQLQGAKKMEDVKERTHLENILKEKR